MGSLLNKTLGGALFDSLRGEGSGKYRGKLTALLNQERDVNRMYGDATLEALRRGNEAAVGGYDQAIGKASDISRSARREAITRGEGLEGQLVARMGAGGKFGTTALDNARMGLASSLTRDLEGIDSAFSGLFSELAIGKGQAIQGGEQGIAGFQQLRAGQESDYYQRLAGLVKPPKQGMLSGVLGAAGVGLGSYFSGGNPQAAAVGGELGSALGGAYERD